jgi:hypothetical protein
VTGASLLFVVIGVALRALAIRRHRLALIS